MIKDIKLLACLICAVCFFGLQAVRVFAQDAANAARCAVEGRINIEAQGIDEAGTWDELSAWMAAHTTEGGSVRLTAPIAYNGKSATLTRRVGAQPATLDLGEFGLTVSGALELYCPGLTIRGQGGESSSLRVLPGGDLALGYIDIQPGENGAVLWQDEGGILALEQPVAQQGAVHFATRPIAQPTNTKPSVTTVLPGEAVADKLPKTISAQVYFEGEASYEELAAAWRLTDEETAVSLSQRRRTLIFGEFADIDTYGAVSCILTFVDRPITFTDIVAKNAKGIRMIEADFIGPADAFTAAVEYSFDEKQWHTAQRLEFAALDKPTIQLEFYEPAEAQDNLLIWDTAQSPTLFLRICRLNAENEAEYYSDELAIDGVTMAISSDTGGNRGGGTAISPPDTLPPPTGGDETENEDSPSSKAPQTLPKAPSDTANAPSEPFNTQKDLPGKPQASPAFSAETDTAHTLPTQASGDSFANSEPFEEQTEPSQNAYTDKVNKPPKSMRALGQAAAGTAATACIIALALTFPRWGRRLAAFVRRIFNKN